MFCAPTSLVSEFVHGITLADLLSARQPSPPEAAALIAKVADALQYAHEHGVVHRDVKPSNIMIADCGLRMGEAWLWNTPAPIQGDPERLRLWTQVITGLDLAVEDKLKVLDAETWLRRRQRLQELGGSPLP